MIVKQPQKYTSANNPIILGFSGQSSDTLYFATKIIEASTGGIVYQGNAFVTPISDVAHINLSNPVSALVRSHVDNDSIIITGKTRPIVAYNVDATEWSSSGGALTQGASYSAGTFYSIEANLDIQNYTNRFTGNTYVVSSGNSDSKFLTLQPDYKQVNDYSTEQLYFLWDDQGPFKMNVDLDGNITQIIYSGDSNRPTIISPAVPETRAWASITISGDGEYPFVNYGDNIEFSIDGNYVGYYSANTIGGSLSQYAANIGVYVFGSQPSGFTAYMPVSTGNTFYVLAPPGYGSSGNNFTLTSGLHSTGYTYNVSSGTNATLTVGGWTNVPESGLTAELFVSSIPELGLTNVSLLTYLSDGSITDITAYTSTLLAMFNDENPYGFIATPVDYQSFMVTAPFINPAYNGEVIEYYGGGDYTYGEFSGGELTYSGTADHNYYLIGHTIDYSFQGGQDATPEITGATVDRLIRLQTSNKKLGLTPTQGQQYSVWISDMYEVPLSEVRTYVYNEPECSLEYMNVIFTNSMGGVDSIQLIQPQDSITSSKQTIQKNNINMASDTPYLTNGVYNASEETINVNSKYQVKAWTQNLSDAECNWLNELIMSKNIYVELTSGELIPVQLQTSTYNNQRLKYNKAGNQFQFTFEFSNGFIPALGLDSIVFK